MKKAMTAAVMAAAMALPAQAETDGDNWMTLGPGALPCSAATTLAYEKYTIAWAEGALSALNAVAAANGSKQEFATLTQFNEVYTLAKTKCSFMPSAAFGTALGAAASEWRQLQ